MAMFRRQHFTEVRPESLICTRDDEHFSTFAYRSPPPGFEHLPFKAVLKSVARCQLFFDSDLSTQYLIAEMLCIE